MTLTKIFLILFFLNTDSNQEEKESYVCGNTGNKYHLNIDCDGLKFCGTGNSISKIKTLNYFPNDRDKICRFNANKPGSCLSKFDSIQTKNINSSVNFNDGSNFNTIIIAVVSIILFLIIFYLIKKQSKKTKQYENKLDTIITKTENFASLVSNLKEKKIEFKELKNEAHHKFLIESITKSKQNIIISSGWITSSVVDDNFIRIIKRKIKEGVSILIIYGYRFKGKHNNSNEDVILELKNISINSSGKFVLKEGKENLGNHSKCLIIDKKMIAIGSYNWLSTGKKTRNTDSSVIIFDEDYAFKESKYFYDF